MVTLRPYTKKAKQLSRKLCSNYRPVTLTSQIVKLLEHLVHQLLTRVQGNNIISCHQHGFLQNVHVSCMNDWTQSYDTNWKWFKDVRHDSLPKDSITPALSQTC